MARKKFVGSWVILILLILFCWPAALIYFFVKYEEDPSSETRTCMNCGAKISLSYAFCPFCGRSPIQYQPLQQTSDGRSDTSINYCRSCGTKVEPEHGFCKMCGTKLK
ncbi:MAG: zinc ribbon domain-containing protein [Methanomassiliicoccales archaeon]|nr:MAG: zinc ribbon domain-containing protein [Methanomassiliicoccales archaeon]